MTARPDSHRTRSLADDTPDACADSDGRRNRAAARTSGTVVRDKDTGCRRPITPADIAILFRTRDSHREFEAALERRGIAAYVYKGLGFFDADEIKDVLALLWYLADPLSDLRAAALLRSRFLRLSDEALRRLAPHLAAALAARGRRRRSSTRPTPRRWRRRASACARWRGLVDRIPPAELLDLVLAESAYFVEMRGPRLRQARENLKKMRALIRRIQNRGYATLGRIAAHLDRLAVGDESNAVIDALDAVNLMTVHASKGLEFPVVFLVNLARGTGGFRDPIRVVADPGGDDVSVAVGDFAPTRTRTMRRGRREETKRLLYVALTRARDRLYLGSVLKEGSLQPGRGSLAEVLPRRSSISSPRPAMVVEWRASSGAVHRFRVICARRRTSNPRTSNLRIPNPASRIPDCRCARATRRPAPDSGCRLHQRLRSTATRAVRPHRRPASDRSWARSCIGCCSASVWLPSRDIRRDVSSDRGHAWCAPDEIDESDDVRCTSSTPRWRPSRRSAARDDMRVLYRSGSDAARSAVHDVDRWTRRLRGTVDCLVETAPGHFTVLEFKTGRERPKHRAQVELYLQAMQAGISRLRDGRAVDLYGAERNGLRCIRRNRTNSH